MIRQIMMGCCLHNMPIEGTFLYDYGVSSELSANQLLGVENGVICAISESMAETQEESQSETHTES